MNIKVNFSLTQLEYVLAVHRYGHFAKAAKSCFVTQPTLSMQIQKLEEDMGTAIFDRSKKPITLTDKGKKLVEQMQNIIFEAKKIEAILLEEKAKKYEGNLTLAIIPTIAPYLIPRLLPVIEKEYPLLTLTILEKQTHEIISALENDEIDIGILATPLKIKKIHERPLYWEPFSILCKKNHELAKLKKAKYSSLQTNDIWLLEEGHCLRHQVLDVCSLKKKENRKFQFESGSLETLKQLVNAYGGYTLLPALATESIGPNTTLIPFERPAPAREIGLVYRRENYKTELFEALGNAISASIPEELKRKKELEVLPV